MLFITSTTEVHFLRIKKLLIISWSTIRNVIKRFSLLKKTSNLKINHKNFFRIRRVADSNFHDNFWEIFLNFLIILWFFIKKIGKFLRLFQKVWSSSDSYENKSRIFTKIYRNILITCFSSEKINLWNFTVFCKFSWNFLKFSWHIYEYL